MLAMWIDRSIDVAVDRRGPGLPAPPYATPSRRAPKDKTMNHTKRIAVLLLLAIGASAGLTGCNTVRGIGKDTERAGEKIQKEADREQSSRVDGERNRATTQS
jgi:predicted small secreted protein